MYSRCLRILKRPNGSAAVQRSWTCTTSAQSRLSRGGHSAGAIVRLSATNDSNNTKHKCHHYTTIALTRDLPDSFGDAIVEHYDGESSDVSLATAKAQHDDYIAAFREFGVSTLSLPAAHGLPDSVFVEDTAVVIRHGDDDTRAIILQPGHVNRQPEVDHIRSILQRLLPADQIWEMAAMDPDARCDGGDVLYTGRHLFVGVSERTNEEALQVMEHVFAGLPLVPVVMPAHAPVLHLKSAVTHLDDTTLVAPTAPWANRLLRSMRATALGYDVIRIPSVLACNVVVLPRGLLLQDTRCAESRQLLQKAAQARGLPHRWVDTSELAKKDAALTCCSILLP